MTNKIQRVKLNWTDEDLDLSPSGRYFRASVCEVKLFVHPHGWDVYNGSTHLSGPFTVSVDDRKVQAEMAARQLLEPYKADWNALWNET